MTALAPRAGAAAEFRPFQSVAGAVTLGFDLEQPPSMMAVSMDLRLSAKEKLFQSDAAV